MQELSTEIPRPKGFLLDIGGTILQANSFDFAVGIQALNPTIEGKILAAELQAAISVVRRSNMAEFAIIDWLVKKRDRFGIEGSITDLARIVYHETFRPSPMPGVRSALQLIHDHNLPVGCITNTIFPGQVLQHELEYFGFSGLIRFVISSADSAVRKPSPDIFMTGVLNLDLHPTETWFIGDTWAADITGATHVGLYPVWLSTLRKSPHPSVFHTHAASWPEISQVIIDVLS